MSLCAYNPHPPGTGVSPDTGVPPGTGVPRDQLAIIAEWLLVFVCVTSGFCII